jgi:hypothetical protein
MCAGRWCNSPTNDIQPRGNDNDFIITMAVIYLSLVRHINKRLMMPYCTCGVVGSGLLNNASVEDLRDHKILATSQQSNFTQISSFLKIRRRSGVI